MLPGTCVRFFYQVYGDLRRLDCTTKTIEKVASLLTWQSTYEIAVEFTAFDLDVFLADLDLDLFTRFNQDRTQCKYKDFFTLNIYVCVLLWSFDQMHTLSMNTIIHHHLLP